MTCAVRHILTVQEGQVSMCGQSKLLDLGDPVRVLAGCNFALQDLIQIVGSAACCPAWFTKTRQYWLTTACCVYQQTTSFL